MNKKIVLTVCCCASILCWGEKPKPLSLQDITITAAKAPKAEESSSDNSPVLKKQKPIKCGPITIKQPSVEEKVAYPLEESNYDKVFGGKP